MKSAMQTATHRQGNWSGVLISMLFVFLAGCGSGGVGVGGTPGSAGGPAIHTATTDEGAPTGAPVESTIGPEGGELASADGILRIVIPSGALTAPTLLSVTPITNEAPGGLAGAYRLGPEGQAFASPVEVVFTFADEDLVGSTLDALGVAYQDEANQWHFLTGVMRDEGAHELSAAMTHFSDWANVRFVHIEPGTASVEPSQAIELRLFGCLSVDEAPDGRLLGDCGPVSGEVSWTVNGVTRGNATQGTVESIGDTPGAVNYLAPAQTPASNPVAVSAELLGNIGNLVVTSNVDVGGHPTWAGTVTTITHDDFLNLSSTTNIEAEVVWVWRQEEGFYRPQGNFSYNMTFTDSFYPCTGEASAGGLVRYEDGSLAIFENNTYFGNGGQLSTPVTQTDNCNSDREFRTTTAAGPIFWWPPSVGSGQLSADGQTVAGTVTVPALGTGTSTITWHFDKQP